MIYSDTSESSCQSFVIKGVRFFLDADLRKHNCYSMIMNVVDKHKKVGKICHGQFNVVKT